MSTAKRLCSRDILNLRPVMSDLQIMCMVNGIQGEESAFFFEKLAEIKQTVEQCPRTYETDGQGDAAMCRLHYFKGNSHAYITELDVSGPPHTQAFGVISLNGYYPELGYINIQELIENGFELDLYYTNESVGDVKRKLNQ